MEKWWCDDFHEDEDRKNSCWRTPQAWLKEVRPFLRFGVMPRGVFEPNCDMLALSYDLHDALRAFRSQHL